MIFGINTTSDISKLLHVISRAVRRVKFETILKYHEWYLCQISRTNHAINYTKTGYFIDLIFQRYSKLFKNCLKDNYSKLPVSKNLQCLLKFGFIKDNVTVFQ